MATAVKTRRGATEEERARMVMDGWSEPLNARLPIQKWDKGVVVVGALKSHKQLPGDGDKQGGIIFTIVDSKTGEELCYGAPAILWDTIKGIAFGVVLRIECLGQIIKTRRGQNAWAFDVRVKA